jgi:hypothetical protein
MPASADLRGSDCAALLKTPRRGTTYSHVVSLLSTFQPRLRGAAPGISASSASCHPSVRRRIRRVPHTADACVYVSSKQVERARGLSNRLERALNNAPPINSPLDQRAHLLAPNDSTTALLNAPH